MKVQTERAPIRDLERLAGDIEAADLKSFNGIRQLEAHIQATWSCKEVALMNSFLHGGRFIPDSKGWVRETRGISTPTHQEDTNLSQLWSRLMYTIHTFMGAASMMGLMGSRIFPGLVITCGDKGASLWDLSINELVHLVMDEKAKHFNLVTAVREAAKKGAIEGLSQKLPRAVKSAYNQSIEDLENTRHGKSGAGRQKIHDIGDIQVCAVLALMERCRENKQPLTSKIAYSNQILRNPPKGVKSPYRAPATLDSAVRRYCLTHGIAYDPPLGK